MWKYLLVFGVVLGLSVFVTRENQKHAYTPAQDSKHPIGAAPTSKADAAQPQNDKGKTEWHMPSWYVFFTWPEGITVWALLLTLAAIADQTHQTARACYEL